MQVYGEMAYTVGIANYAAFVKINEMADKCNVLLMKRKYRAAGDTDCKNVWVETLTHAGHFNVCAISKIH